MRVVWRVDRRRCSLPPRLRNVCQEFWTLVSLLLFAALAAGCSGPVGAYFARRGRDFGDCFHATAGVAPALAYGRVEATSFLRVGVGAALATRYGWRGRYGGGWGWGAQSRGWQIGEVELGFPVSFPSEGEGAVVEPAEGLLPTVSLVPDAPGSAFPGPAARIAQHFRLGAAASLLLSARLDVNPVELGDFLAGWAGWDLLGDDAVPVVRTRDGAAVVRRLRLARLAVAARRWDIAKLRALLDERPETIRERETLGWTWLHHAAAAGRLDAARLLLERGADVAARTPIGQTPLHLAARGGHAPVALLLLANRADPSALTHDGRSAADCALSRGHEALAQLLRRHGGK